ncbi:MAG: type II toxin-antitoxin system VapC family toxin [Longimicrobiales bacterium]
MAFELLSGALTPARSFENDCLLTASARADGFILVTQNRRDFSPLAEVLSVEVVEPWPGMP